MNAGTPRQPHTPAPATAAESTRAHDTTRPAPSTDTTAIRPARDCRFRTRAGAACPFKAAHPDGGCASHSQTPEALAARRERSVKGGHGRSNLRRAVALIRSGPYAPIAATLERAIAECYSGELDPARGHAIAALARSVVAVADAAVVADRLNELEAEVARIRSGGADETFTQPRPPLVTLGG